MKLFLSIITMAAAVLLSSAQGAEILPYYHTYSKLKPTLVHQKQIQSIWSNQIYCKIPECCDRVQVKGGGNALQVVRAELFSTYKIEKELTNGHASYTSADGTQAISVDTKGNWILQRASNRQVHSRSALTILSRK